MSSRALSLATVLLLIGCAVAERAWAQATNLEAGKTPSQLFAQTCNACHKSPRGLLKSVPASSLPGFLRQHYTTSSDMAGVLASYLVSNGATDTRYSGGQPPKGGKEANSSAAPSGAPDQLDRSGRRQNPRPPQDVAGSEESKPDAETAQAKRQARPGAAQEGAKEIPAEAANERGPDGRKLSAKQKLSKRSKPGGEEAAKSEAAKQSPPAADEKPKNETTKVETGKDEGKAESTKPALETKPDAAKTEPGKSESAKAEPPKEGTPILRPDPVPPVTPASTAPAKPLESAAASGSAEPAVTKAPEPSPAVAASAPPSPPVAPAGPPAPPISQ
ncbi:MAG: hypothetical protein HY852_13355 [Bradyrhizobium sp.]|uniref:hypothetical protein n=1 Tax=Bradyrhizobium sp. TaxID=376 RepID=UPI0025BB9F3B|nr:hypothetical protein [Bradyrhizobium sp.]MBI5262793.1 hypothetical protein [Bradyrhizobium sp.]